MIFQTLKKSGLPVAYGRFKSKTEPPFIIYLGNGQNIDFADNEPTFKKNEYQIQLCFKNKDEAVEESLEQVLVSDGFNYEKAEDIYIESEDLFVIYYTV